MSERIAEAELDRLDAMIRRDWVPGLPVAVEDGWPLRLIAEVRRLRGLIAAAHPDFPPSMDEAVGHPAAVDAIEAEARTIRDEGLT